MGSGRGPWRGPGGHITSVLRALKGVGGEDQPGELVAEVLDKLWVNRLPVIGRGSHTLIAWSIEVRRCEITRCLSETLRLLRMYPNPDPRSLAARGACTYLPAVMIRATRQRAALLALTAALASFLATSPDRVLCLAPGDHVAVEPVHPESGCRTLSGGSQDEGRSLTSPQRACVDVPLDMGFGTTSARPPSTTDRQALTVDFTAVAFAAAVQVPAPDRSRSLPLPARSSSSDGLRLGTVVLLI